MSESLFLQEILSTPRALADTIAAADDRATEVARSLLRQDVRRIVAIGSGSSYFAGGIAAYLYRALATTADPIVWAEAAGDFDLYPPKLSPNDVVVAVSASGEGGDVINLLAKLRGRCQTVGITNAPESTLTRRVDHVLPLVAGTGQVPTSTKTFVASVAALDLLFLALLAETGHEQAGDLREELRALPRQVERTLSGALAASGVLADRLGRCSRLFVLGAGPSYPLALEDALVFKEVVGLPAEGVQTHEMAHGAIAVVDESVGVIALDSPGAPSAVTRRVLGQCADQGAVTIAVGADDDLPVEAASHDLLSPIVYASPVFILADACASRRGRNPDAPGWESAYLRLTRNPERESR